MDTCTVRAISPPAEKPTKPHLRSIGLIPARLQLKVRDISVAGEGGWWRPVFSLLGQNMKVRDQERDAGEIFLWVVVVWEKLHQSTVPPLFDQASSRFCCNAPASGWKDAQLVTERMKYTKRTDCPLGDLGF